MEKVKFDTLVRSWKATAKQVRKMGGEIRAFEIGPPATETEIQTVERQLGEGIPTSFRNILKTCSKKVEISWCLPDHLELKNDFSEIFSGGLGWSLDGLVALEVSRKEWTSVCFPNPSDPYDFVWHRKLSFFHVPNGDQIALDLSTDRRGRVIYLSHEDGEGHGVRLGASFEDYLTRMTPLHLVGPEDWQWFIFHDVATNQLNDQGQTARRFKDIFELLGHRKFDLLVERGELKVQQPELKPSVFKRFLSGIKSSQSLDHFL